MPRTTDHTGNSGTTLDDESTTILQTCARVLRCAVRVASLTNLTSLHLINTQLKTISPLASLTKADQSAISALVHLTNLTSLALLFNHISDVTELALL